MFSCRRLAVLGAALVVVTLARASEPLRVALVAGNEEPIYRAEENLAALRLYLEGEHGFECELVVSTNDGTQLSDPAALERADAAVIFVRRKTPDPATLAAIRSFFASGKGVVALRTTSHAWENWPGFDVEVLGADYGRHAGPAQTLHFPDPGHPILSGALDFTTSHDLYRYELRRKSPGLQVLIEGTTANGEQPVAWTTSHDGGRIFYLGLGHDDEFDKPSFRRMVSNGLYWVSHRLVPGAKLQIERTFMPDAAPSAFAVGFSNGVSFCYDPVRGGLVYAWVGGFIDRTSVRPGMGKHIDPVTLQGPIVYQESTPQPLRRGDPTKVPTVRFTGYRLLGQAIVFTYTVDGVPVREEVRPRPAADGLIRRFRIGEGESKDSWWYLPGVVKGDARLIDQDGAAREEGGFRLPDISGAEFVMEILFSDAKS